MIEFKYEPENNWHSLHINGTFICYLDGYEYEMQKKIFSELSLTWTIK